MMVQDGLTEVLERRKNRAIAAILGVKEREDRAEGNRVSAMSANRVRKVVLDQMNDYCDLAKDLLQSVCDANHVVLNGHYLDRLESSLDRFDAFLDGTEKSTGGN